MTRAAAAIATLLIALAMGPVHVGDPDSLVVPGEILVQVIDAAMLNEVSRAIESLGYDVLEALDPLPILRVRLPDGAEPRAAERLTSIANVLSVSPVARLRTLAVPNDPLYREHQWDLRRLEMEAVWDITTGDPSVIAAVLDTGVDSSHPDLAPNILAGYDFLNDDPDPADDGVHGTHVAGIIAAVGNNGEGIAGMAWRSRILPVKVLDAQGLGPDVAVAKGIIYSVEQGARIINVSSGTPFPSAALKEAVEFADRRGALVIAAAGNTADRGNDVVYPAAYPQVLAVGALDERDLVPPFSQRQSYVALAAPGVNIASTTWRGGTGGIPYGTGTGTSAAAPHVSALAALVWSVDPRLSKNDVRRLITENADDVGPPGRDDGTGFGQINPSRTLRALLSGARRPAGESTASGTPDSPASTPVHPVVDPLRPIPPPSAGGSAAPAPYRWFFADGRTRGGVDTRLVLFNPEAASVNGQITFTMVDGTSLVAPVRVDPFDRLTVQASEFVPDAEFSVRVETEATVYVERTITFGHDLATLAGARGPSTAWYFAEGLIDATTESTIVIANPDQQPSQLVVRVFDENGPIGEIPRIVAPGSRIVVDPSDLLASGSFSAAVTADVPVVAEQRLLTEGGQAGDASGGTKAPSRVWYFAEGDARPDFSTRIALFNPNTTATRVSIQVIHGDGPGQSTTVEVPRLSRRSLDLGPLAGPARFGLRLESALPIAADRSTLVGGSYSLSSGVNQPASEWYLAEGDTTADFLQSISIVNPNSEPVGVDITLYPDDGRSTRLHRLRLRPMTRAAVDVNRIFPDARVALKISADKAVVVERTMFLQSLRGSSTTPAIPN